MISALLLAASAPSFVVGDLQVFGDWAVGCDNGRDCHAASLPIDEETNEPVGDGNLTLSIKRSGNPEGTVSVIFSTASAGSVDVSESVAAQMRTVGLVAVDDRTFGIRLAARDRGYGLNGKAAIRLIAAMRGKNNVSVLDRSGRPVATASLRGLDKTLEYIDAQQHLAGTVAALARPGKKPVNARTVPPMLPRQRIRVAGKPDEPSATIDDVQLMGLRTRDPCLEYSNDEKPGAPIYHRLDSANTLMILPTTCGGYNPYSMLFIVNDNGRAVQAGFWDYPGNPLEEDPQLPDVGWDEKARLLSSFGRGRGLADCGQIQDYAWYQGKFKLVFDAGMSPCRGSFDYITTYRIEVVIDESIKSLRANPEPQY